jgi:hypothetical protein
MTMKEVSTPPNFYCRSGHAAPEVFQRDPPKPATPTRFFRVSSDSDPTVDGTYCEVCLIVSRAIANGQVGVRRLDANEPLPILVAR